MFLSTRHLFLCFLFVCLVPAHVWKITVTSAVKSGLCWSSCATSTLLLVSQSPNQLPFCWASACFHHVCVLPVLFQFTTCSAVPVFLQCCAQRYVFMSGFYSFFCVCFSRCNSFRFSAVQTHFQSHYSPAGPKCILVQQQCSLLAVMRWFW